MQNIIAVIWDFDKTLVDGYMQDPIFNEYGINASDFWKEVNELPQKHQAEGVKVNKDTIYLNQFIRYTQEGKFKGLKVKPMDLLKSLGMAVALLWCMIFIMMSLSASISFIPM